MEVTTASAPVYDKTNDDRHKFSKVHSTAALCGKYTEALTFQNWWHCIISAGSPKCIYKLYM